MGVVIFTKKGCPETSVEMSGKDVVGLSVIVFLYDGESWR